MAKNNNLYDFLQEIGITLQQKNKLTTKINAQNFTSELEKLTYVNGATATSADIRKGKIAYINSEKVIGTIPTYNGKYEFNFLNDSTNG